MTLSAGDAGLQLLPLSDAKGDIDLGEVTKNGLETKTSRTVVDNAGAIGLSAESLLLMAKTDDTLDLIRNIYANYDESTGQYVMVMPSFSWSYGELLVDTVSDPAATVRRLRGYEISFVTNNPTLDLKKTCDQTDALVMVPPSRVATLGDAMDWSPEKPFSSGTGRAYQYEPDACSAGDFYFNEEKGDPSGRRLFIGMQCASGRELCEYMKTPVPSGEWKLRSGAAELAVFDGSLGTPFEDNNTSKPTIPIPSIKVVSAEGTVKRVEVSWNLRNPDGGYARLEDKAYLKSRLPFVGIALSNFAIKREDDKYEAAALSADTNYVFTLKEQAWGVPGSGKGSAEAQYISLSFYKDGVDYKFTFIIKA